MTHLFVDISSHGFGHLAQTAPVIDALHAVRPELRLTVRCGLPRERVAARIRSPFAHLHEASDFGFAMQDALSIDHAATRSRYEAAHSDWPARVEREAGLLASLGVDRVLSNVAYLPLAGAARLGVPALAMCSLNWADLFGHFYGHRDPLARRIHGEIRAAYATAPFLALEPGMPFPGHPRCIAMPPVAIASGVGKPQTDPAAEPAARTVLVAFGGIPLRLPVERWAARRDIAWLVPGDWTDALRHPACRSIESMNLAFTELLPRVDAVLTKPGYGTFVEAATAGTPVLYLRRDDWPEQDVLIDWLHRNARARELSADALAADRVAGELDALWRQPARPKPAADGARQVARWIDAWLGDDR